MVDSAQSHHQLGGNKLLGKLQNIASAPTQTLLARAIPTKPIAVTTSQVVTNDEASIGTKMSILQKMRQSFNVGSMPAQNLNNQIILNQPVSQLNELDALDEAIAQVETMGQAVPIEIISDAVPVLDGSLVQALPQAAQQAVAASQPQVGGRSLAKESAVGAVALDQIANDAAGMAGGPTEMEPPRELEIPVEVESYLEKVENNVDQLPQEIVVADDGTNIISRPYPKQPVIVLPVTPDIEKDGATKSPNYSVRWLVEWSRKIMKMFEGMVIYRQDVVN